jgi:ABC-type phosphate/phosphonate transport system ATPase subunit
MEAKLEKQKKQKKQLRLAAGMLFQEMNLEKVDVIL